MDPYFETGKKTAETTPDPRGRTNMASSHRHVSRRCSSPSTWNPRGHLSPRRRNDEVPAHSRLLPSQPTISYQPSDPDRTARIILSHKELASAILIQRSEPSMQISGSVAHTSKESARNWFVARKKLNERGSPVRIAKSPIEINGSHTPFFSDGLHASTRVHVNLNYGWEMDWI